MPCFLRCTDFSSSSDNVLDLFVSSSPLLELSLHRRITHLVDANQTLGSAASGTGTKNIAVKTTETALVTATLWKPTTLEASQSRSVCFLEGEFHLPNDLTPSCNVGFFAVEVSVSSSTSETISLIGLQYIVSLAPPSSSDVQTSQLRSNPTIPPTLPTSSSVLSCPITITTFHVHGPLPTPFTTPPRHTSSMKKVESRSNIREEDVLFYRHNRWAGGLTSAT